MSLDLFRVNVLARRQHDHVLLAPGDVEMTLTIKAAEIARTKPLVGGEGFAVRLWVMVVTGHDDRSADEHLTDAFAVRLVDLDLDATQRRANRADLVILEARHRRGRRGLRQPVALENGEA